MAIHAQYHDLKVLCARLDNLRIDAQCAESVASKSLDPRVSGLIFCGLRARIGEIQDMAVRVRDEVAGEHKS